jgi:hypothetical protein
LSVVAPLHYDGAVLLLLGFVFKSQRVQILLTLFLVLVFKIILIGAEDCVPNTEERGIVANVVTVMEVVVLGTSTHR